jgi:mannan endo-1,6-alpha-mannosidase
MSYYRNNATDTAFKDVGTFPYPPYYWWESGAIWGGMVNYWAYTGDTSYVETTTQALLAQVGPTNDYMAPDWYFSIGNDDQAFWAIACLNAAEYHFPVPTGNSSTVWLDLAEAVFNTQIARWDTADCNGGLRWQIFSSNKGYDYKNSISNGGLFHIAARLAKLTGNQTYVEWAEKTWNWMFDVKFIDANYNVYDGAEIPCNVVNKVMWTYNPSMLLYGSAVLFNYTNGAAVWENRTTGLLKTCINTFFSPYPNATNV